MWYNSLKAYMCVCVCKQGFSLIFHPLTFVVCYLSIETDTQGLKLLQHTKKCKYLVSRSAVRPEWFCVSGLMITDACISDQEGVVKQTNKKKVILGGGVVTH